jgi:DNA-binding Lrp family transcriptional regulator
MDELLHALRIKGRATADELAAALEIPPEEIGPRLRALEADGLAIERATGRRPGWMVSPEGRDAHAEQAKQHVTGEVRAEILQHYKRFLEVNDPTKEVCTIWQTTSDEERRLDLLAELHALHAQASPVLASTGEAIPRFARYGDRLAAALERAGRDPRYVVSPLVDSYHTVWFECHEDFLVTLGRNRHDEGSW